MSEKKIEFRVKQKMIELAGACFWYFNSLDNFLESSGVSYSLRSRYPKGVYKKGQIMRCILRELESKGEIETIKDIIANFFKLEKAVDMDNLDQARAKVLLKEFKDLVGNDPIKEAIRKQEKDEKTKLAKQESEEKRAYSEKLQKLKAQFVSTCINEILQPQMKGFELERMFTSLLELEEFEYKKPYKSNGEQIDGWFEFEKFDYLVEIKCIKGLEKQSDLSIFDGKIKNKAQSTRGLFFAINGFDDNVIEKFSGNAPRIIFMDGLDFMNILEERKTFYDCMRAKVQALVQHGNVFLRTYL